MDALHWHHFVCIPMMHAILLSAWLHPIILYSLHYILNNTLNVVREGVKWNIAYFATKSPYNLASNWMQRFQFGCNPDLTDLTFLLPQLGWCIFKQDVGIGWLLKMARSGRGGPPAQRLSYEIQHLCTVKQIKGFTKHV